MEEGRGWIARTTSKPHKEIQATLSRFTTSTAAKFLKKKIFEGVDPLRKVIFWMRIKQLAGISQERAESNCGKYVKPRHHGLILEKIDGGVFGVVAWPWQIDIEAGDHNSGFYFVPV